MAAQNVPLSSGGPRDGALGPLTLTAVSLIGLVAFLAPFFVARPDAAAPTGGYTLLIGGLLVAACLIVLFANLGPSLSSKSVALLGVLVAVNAALRAFDLAFLPPGEFSPIFLLIALVGYTFGAQHGFLMGALTLLVSALLTGGIGPWLPYQMFTAGWMGMSAGWLAALIGRRRNTPLPRVVVLLAIFGFAWGLLYGLIISLYDWPLRTGQFAPVAGASFGERLSQYLTFYAALSFVPDLVRAFGNAALTLILGVPLLRAFARFRARFDFTVLER